MRRYSSDTGGVALVPAYIGLSACLSLSWSDMSKDGLYMADADSTDTGVSFHDLRSLQHSTVETADAP